LAASLVVASDTSLSKCAPDSIVQALIGIAMSDLNVDKNIGHAYLVPYKGSCQLQIGYRGYIQLLHRAGWAVKAFPVYHCDHFEMSFDGWDNKITFVPAIDERDEGDKDWVIHSLRGVYVVARHADTKDEYSTFVSKAVIEKLRLNSPNQRASEWTKPEDKKRLDAGLPIGIWKDWYTEMAMAKAIKKLAKILPIGDSRVHTTIAADDKSEIGARVDYQKTAAEGVVIEAEPINSAPVRRGRSIDDIIGEKSPIEGESVNYETGEIIHESTQSIDADIKNCKTLSDIATLLRDLSPEHKAKYKVKIRARQDEIKAAQVVSE